MTELWHLLFEGTAAGVVVGKRQKSLMSRQAAVNLM
jgi:hypothetical protein